ncbi:proline dehydrogenase [Trichosporon asahii var. asahii CBS 2479]|uniref:Proline dehydrogenase n=1 Tax=Trichosporon asahii var. asahii (strain ATCC 90039 / CBS 2479 / JCM 2466 / KCTC 7840 / NBRC 103889/ NCYC 2677 / UAMH 7654) TaxID=1186058 RepID=J8TZW0_TRIAS|nr:proline dehydrogenase [Trichosporon asahii var. asahii CBS 2479]EJT53285.1 proline dehydrogenase [Trichosporon asahii var. asahii CBS 2479]
MLSRSPLRLFSRSFGGRVQPLKATKPIKARPVTSAAPAPSASSGSHHQGHHQHGNNQHQRWRFGRYAAVPLVVATGAVMTLRSRAKAEEPTSGGLSGISGVPASALVRAYLVYTLCGFPTLIDISPKLLDVCTKSPIPGVKQVTEVIIRRTFFDQFVAGEDIPECIRSVNELGARGIGGVLNYSAEAEHDDGKHGDSHRAAEDANYQESYHAIEALGRHEASLPPAAQGSASYAIKLSGLIDIDILERASNTLVRMRPLAGDKSLTDAPYPGVPQVCDAVVIAPSDTTSSRAMIPSVSGAIEPTGILASDPDVSDSDLAELKVFWEKMRRLSDLAADSNVRLMIDAEYAATQPAMDALTQLLSMEYNRPRPGKPYHGPIIFGTYQSYLRRAPHLLDSALKHAEENGYALGIKIVRGAYFVKERKRWLKDGRTGADPIWPDKPATDAAYNQSVSKIVSTLQRQLSGPRPDLALSVVFATHNPESVAHVTEELKRAGLAEPSAETEYTGRLRLRDDVRGKLFVAQLFGMRDDITDGVVQTFDSGAVPVALKYIAYGKLDEVLPFLARRAIENKAVMAGEGGASVERKRVSDELWRRLVNA